MKTPVLLLLVASFLFASGCLYRVPVQQGNILKEDDIKEVQLGMSRRQVSLILGTPAIADPFHQDRWDYISTSKVKGKFHPVKKLTIYFDNGKVSRIENHYPVDGTTQGKKAENN